MADETNLILTMGFIGWLMTSGYLPTNTSQQTTYDKPSDPPFMEDLKKESKSQAEAAYRNKNAEYEVRLKESMAGWSSIPSYQTFKRYADTRIFGDWEQYSDTYGGGIMGA